jgi:hypothetical protein
LADTLWSRSSAIAVVSLALIVTPEAALAASSTSLGVGAQFIVGDLATSLPPLAMIQGATPPDYNKAVALAQADQVLDIAPGTIPVPALFLAATQLDSHVQGAFGVDTQSSSGDATLHTVNLSLNLNPPPPALPVPQPFLAVSATTIASHSSFSDQVPLPPVALGSVSFGSLVVSGSLIGTQVLTFSGTAPKNKILYQSPTATATDVPNIVITLNKEIRSVIIECNQGTPGCVAQTTGIVTEALNICLHRVNLHGHIVSGEIIVGYTSAQ